MTAQETARLARVAHDLDTDPENALILLAEAFVVDTEEVIPAERAQALLAQLRRTTGRDGRIKAAGLLCDAHALVERAGAALHPHADEDDDRAIGAARIALEEATDDLCARFEISNVVRATAEAVAITSERTTSAPDREDIVHAMVDVRDAARDEDEEPTR